MNDYLRKKVKELKVFQDISYKELAELLEMNTRSFYNWLNAQYDFGEEKQNRLKFIVENIKED